VTTDGFYPMGITGFERRELAGHPHAWDEDDEVLVTEQRLKDYPEWVVTARFQRGGHRTYLVGLSIDPASMLPYPPTAPLNTDVIRSVKLDQLFRRARTTATDSGVAMQEQASGKERRPDQFYLDLAVRYLQLVEETNSPTKHLAQDLGVSLAKARDLVREARRRKLMTMSTRGRAGGELTTEALRLLNRDPLGARSATSAGQRTPKATSRSSRSTGQHRKGT
jgi:hypothetical protein